MKKLLTVVLSCFLLFTMVACTNKGNKTTEDLDNVTMDEGYYNTYTGLYDKNIATIASDDNLNYVKESYRGAQYPGNRQYLDDVKAAYKDSRDKIQVFINGLKNDAKTEDTELKKMNESLISEGEKAIQDIDAKIAKLDKISANDYNKSEDDFMKLVDDTVNTGDKVGNKFRDMLKDMDKRLGIDRTTNENNMNNTDNTKK